MLYTNDYIKLIGLDPGLNNTGVSVVNYSKTTRSITSIEAFTISPSNDVKRHELSAYTTERATKQIILKEIYKEIVSSVRPDIVICEDAFFYGNKPVAFQALVESITLLRHTTIDVDPMITFVMLSPMEIKHSLKVKNVSDKDSTREALMDLGIKNIIDIDNLVEHSVDAIAVCYSFLKTRDFL